MLKHSGKRASALLLSLAVAAAAFAVPPPVAGVEGEHEREGENVRGGDACAYRGAGSLYVPLGGAGEQQAHEDYDRALLYEMHERGLPYPPAGGEISGEHA